MKHIREQLPEPIAALFDVWKANVMQKDFLMLSPEMNLQDVYTKMLANVNVCNVYPVKDNGKLIGIIDKENVSELILVQQATQEKGCKTYLVNQSHEL